MIIGFAGKIGTGKTTTAKMVRESLLEQGMPTAIFSFGAVLKTKVAEVYNFPLTWTASPEGKAKYISTGCLDQTLVPPACRASGKMTVRQALQYYATEIVRAKDPDYWVRQVADAIEMSHKTRGTRVALVDDVRFPNELEYIKAHGACYRLLPYDGWQPGYESGHTSETALDGLPVDGDFEPVYGHLDQIATIIFGRLRGLYGL